MNMRSSSALVLVVLSAACLLQPGYAFWVDYSPTAVQNKLTSLAATPPVTNFLITPNTVTSLTATIAATGNSVTAAQRNGWKRIGAKIWFFLSNYDLDYLNAQSQPTPPFLAGVAPVTGPTVTCGRNARQLIRLPFHDCGTFDIGNTGSEGDNGSPRFGCNGSLRKEVGPCNSNGPNCVNGVDTAIDPATGAFVTTGGVSVNAFDDVRAKLDAKYPGANLGAQVDWVQPAIARPENTGFANNLAFLYQIQLEAQAENFIVSYADVMMYAGMLAVAKCGGPHIEFQPGRLDVALADGPERLPSPVEPLSHSVAYFWTNGVTSFDMVNLLAAHTVACFSIGCLDNTPNKYDADWARVLLTLQNILGNDQRICQFTAAGLPPPVAKQLCSLPADAEFAARDDTVAYLQALTSSSVLAIPLAANRLGSPFHPAASCPAGAGCRPVAPFVPFRVITNANLCNRLLGVTKVGCPTATVSAPKNFLDAVATSYFKMSKWYPRNNNAALTPVVHANFDVRPQPCQPGLVKIGAPLAPGDVEPLNPVCSCCPNALPQRWSYIPPDAGAVAALSATAASAPAALPGAEWDSFAVRKAAAPAPVPEPATELLSAVPIVTDAVVAAAAAAPQEPVVGAAVATSAAPIVEEAGMVLPEVAVVQP